MFSKHLSLLILPAEIIAKIVKYLNDESRANLRLSCKVVYAIVRSTVRLRKQHLLAIGGLNDTECWGCDNYEWFENKNIVLRGCTCKEGPSTLLCNEAISPPSHQELIWELQRPMTHLIWEIERMLENL